MEVSDFKPGNRVKIVNLTWSEFNDHPADLMGKFGTVVESPLKFSSSTYVDVEVDGLEGTHYEHYMNDRILFLPKELELA